MPDITYGIKSWDQSKEEKFTKNPDCNTVLKCESCREGEKQVLNVS